MTTEQQTPITTTEAPAAPVPAEETPQAKSRHETRLAQLEAIAATAERGEGPMQGFDEDTGEIFKVEDPAAPEAPAPVAEEAVAAPAEEMVTIKVMGVEKQVTKAEALERGIAALQKSDAADLKLQEATRLAEGALQVFESAQKGAPAAPAPVVDATQWTPEKLAHAQQYGSKEEATAANAEILRRIEEVRVIATQAPQQSAFLTDQRLAAKEFSDQYQDVVGDPGLRQLAFIMEHNARKAGDNRPFGLLYKEIGDTLRNRYVKSVPTSAPTQQSGQPTQATGLAAKVAAKAATPAPVSSAASAAPAKEQKREPTLKETIDAMAESRRNPKHNQPRARTPQGRFV